MTTRLNSEKGDHAMRKLTIMSICVVLVFGLSFTSSAIASDEEEVLDVLNSCVKALNTLDASFLSSVWWHSQDASTFGPNKSAAFLTQGWDKIDKSNQEMAKLPAGAMSFSMHNPQVTMISDDVAIATAYFTVVNTNPATSAQDISQDRYTAVLKKIEGKWLIVHGHTSPLPTE